MYMCVCVCIDMWDDGDGDLCKGDAGRDGCGRVGRLHRRPHRNTATNNNNCKKVEKKSTKGTKLSMDDGGTAPRKLEGTW